MQNLLLLYNLKESKSDLQHRAANRTRETLYKSRAIHSVDGFPKSRLGVAAVLIKLTLCCVGIRFGIQYKRN